MTKGVVDIRGTTFPVVSLNTLVIGSGAAGLNAAVRLHAEGQTDIAVVTARFGAGASNNSGSDKQTYYKLSLAGDRPDSPFAMAADLAGGGGMHGDIALVEAQNSAEAFLRLVALGVPFPQDRYGAFVGYKTDNDARQRGTSAGPLTSRLMVEALASEVARRKIPVLDRHDIIALLTSGRAGRARVFGAVALDRKRLDSRSLGFVLLNATNVVLATGGPGGLYRYSVYPADQPGSHGIAFEAGATAHNLTESQFGLASVKFRWNLSGTYQQVIPRYFSSDAQGRDEKDFLAEDFPDMASLATAIFLKGYEWPFDPRKVRGYGSSLIDLLVYRETVVRGRRVFLDYRRNPSGAGRLEDFRLDLLRPEARSYLEKSRALLPSPIARLRRMNRPAIELFRGHGIDLSREPLEIAVCAQHNNGGFKGNIWWESDVRHLFPVGEVNGTHGVYRPGGAALNSGQVGSARAARFIAKRYTEAPLQLREFARMAASQVFECHGFARHMLGEPAPGRMGLLEQGLAEIRERMSSCGAHIRSPETVASESPKAWALVRRLRRDLRVAGPAELPAAFKLLDLALTHAVYLETIREYLDRGGKSRGSYVVPEKGGAVECPALGEGVGFTVAGPDDLVSREVLEVRLDGRGRVAKRWADVRPIPPAEGWFETVWKDFLEDRIVRAEEG